ncbi:hypothetical protein [Sphingomonas gei]|uniref:hypothetical protein n=1 Tax=Sphingomonas gei TaxID=1395960 RepID=UPI00268D989F
MIGAGSWLEAYDFVSRWGVLFLDEYARASNPFSGVGDQTVSVQVTSVVRASSQHVVGGQRPQDAAPAHERREPGHPTVMNE